MTTFWAVCRKASLYSQHLAGKHGRIRHSRAASATEQVGDEPGLHETPFQKKDE